MTLRLKLTLASMFPLSHITTTLATLVLIARPHLMNTISLSLNTGRSLAEAFGRAFSLTIIII
jgi:hypothetical protein